MRVLVVAATEPEIPRVKSGARGAHYVDVLITGVGMVATAARVARALSQTHYDLALNFGLCGTFDRSLALGSAVHVTFDCFAELGAEDGDGFITMQELGLVRDQVISNANPPSNLVLGRLPQVTAITVNTVHGNDDSIARVRARFQPDVESMEGAAFAYACAISEVPYAQVRAVSNLVERRNRTAWKVKAAIDCLNETAERILGCL